jgi:hypothetical protein
MTTLREAAHQALEALELVRDADTAGASIGLVMQARAMYEPTITALKAALEQPEQTNPWRDAVDHELSTLHMVASDDPRESIRRLINWHCAVQIDPLVSSAAQELIERGRREAVLEQPEQVPFGYFRAEPFGWTDCAKTDEGAKALYEKPPTVYTHPPRREWRGLTEEEIVAIFLLAPTQPAFAIAIEAALKERNA